MRVFLSAGEPSGDHHAAALVRELRRRRPDVECVGLGGPEMASAGCELVADLTALAVMWFLRVILNIHRFVELARLAERSFLDARPDVVVLVDFPGFHWWLAWRAKRHGIPVVFYCPPQIWAWASWRARKMRRLVDHVLSALPFEHEWFLARGIPSTLVGHPFFDDVDRHGIDRGGLSEAARPSEGRRLLLLPGSRGQEIEGNLESLLATASVVRERHPATTITVATLHERHGKIARESIAARGLDVEVVAGRTRSLIARADAAIAVSGSVSLELLAARVPTVVVYRISRLAFVAQTFLRHARFITLVNLLAVDDPILPVRPRLMPPSRVEEADPEAIYPEYLCTADPSREAAAHVIDWFSDPESRRRVIERLDRVAARVALPGASGRAADAVIAIAEGSLARTSSSARASAA